MFSSNIYIYSPPRIQELMISARARIRRVMREGQPYKNILSGVAERERWSSEQLRLYQERELRKILQHSAQRVPFYSERFDSVGFNADNASLPESMSILPTLSKRDIIEAGDSMLAEGWRRLGRIKGSTSGTTGAPVTICQDLPAINRENAFITRQLRWAGYAHGERRVWLRGDMIIPARQKEAPFWRMNRSENMLMMSSYHLSERTAASYLRILSEFQPTMIQAFPSSISFLARFLESRSTTCSQSSLRAVVTSSEALIDSDRKLIEERFGCKVFDWYGSFERVAAVGTCEQGTYHLLTDYSYVELEPSGNGVYELIGTGFNNYLMPLVRFRTGDLLELPASGEECSCGRAFPVVSKIHGRTGDYIKMSDGRRIARMGYIFSGIVGIAEAQIIQDELDSIRILVVPFGNFPAESRKSLIDNARQRLGIEAKVDVEIVSEIPRTGSGKFQTIICNI